VDVFFLKIVMPVSSGLCSAKRQAVFFDRLTRKLKVKSSFETSGISYSKHKFKSQKTRMFRGHCCENLKSYALRIFENKKPREIHVYYIEVKLKLSEFIGKILKHKHFSIG